MYHYHSETLIGTLTFIEFLHMLSMLIWTLRPVCCAREALVDEGWHRGEHDGNTSFRPQLEL